MIDPKLIESAAKALGDARDRLLALLPKPEVEKDCLSCKHYGVNLGQYPCDECIGDPTSGHWEPKEPTPAWDEVPEFGDEVEFRGRKYLVLWKHYAWVLLRDLDHVALQPYEFGAHTGCVTVTRKAELRVGDIAESRTTGRRGYVCKICCHWALNAWGRIEHNLTRADLKLIARGEKP